MYKMSIAKRNAIAKEFIEYIRYYILINST